MMLQASTPGCFAAAFSFRVDTGPAATFIWAAGNYAQCIHVLNTRAIALDTRAVGADYIAHFDTAPSSKATRWAADALELGPEVTGTVWITRRDRAQLPVDKYYGNAMAFLVDVRANIVLLANKPPVPLFDAATEAYIAAQRGAIAAPPASAGAESGIEPIQELRVGERLGGPSPPPAADTEAQ